MERAEVEEKEKEMKDRGEGHRRSRLEERWLKDAGDKDSKEWRLQGKMCDFVE